MVCQRDSIDRGIRTSVVCILPKDERGVRLPYPAQMNFQNFHFRTFCSSSDFDGMVNVRRECIETDQVDVLSRLEHFCDADEMFRTIHQNHCQPEKDVLIVEVGGKIVGYCQICWWEENDGTTLFLHVGYLVPQWRKLGVGTKMLEWCENRIIQIAYQHPNLKKAMFGANASSTEIDKLQLLENNGYLPVFTQVELEFNHQKAFDSLSLPSGFQLKPVRQSDLRLIWETINEAYADRPTVTKPTESDLQEFSTNPRNDFSLWQVAWNENEVASLVLCEIKNNVAEITEVCTKAKFRRCGLAQTLLLRGIRDLNERKVESIRLHTSGENVSGALSLYEKVGFRRLKEYLRLRKKMKNWSVITQ